MVHTLPGMGADARIYPPPWNTIANIKFHNWPPYQGETTLSAVAQKLCNLHGISDGDTVIGSSMGGMVACEIAKLRNLSRLILIGSAIHPSEIRGLLAFLHPLANITPLNALRISAGQIPSELAQMFHETEPMFIRAMCKAIFAWKGLGGHSLPFLRIHGKNDMIIPPPPQVDLLLAGGHLLSMTHAQECVAFVMANI